VRPSRPWYVLSILNLVVAMATFLILFNILEDKGFPKNANGGSANGPLTFGILIFMGLCLCLVGMNGVITKHAEPVDDAAFVKPEYTGTSAIVAGGLQCLGGAILIGGSMYGMIFG